MMGLATTAQLPGEVGTVCPRDFERAQDDHLQASGEEFFCMAPSIIYTLFKFP